MLSVLQIQRTGNYKLGELSAHMRILDESDGPKTERAALLCTQMEPRKKEAWG